MNSENSKYCIDANVLIQAWQKYYSPKICPDYWELLNHLGEKSRIFLPNMVAEEITRTEDELSVWLRSSKIPIHNIDVEVTQCLSRIYSADKRHQYLVDNIRQRSLADPWVIAHALKENACVVTKEEKNLQPNSNRIRIPNVCENMEVRCINDFQFITELDIQFSCTIR